MLEATHLKAVRTVVEVIRDDPAVVEVQVVAIAARGSRRPAEPVDADVIQRAVVRVATARLPLSKTSGLSIASRVGVSPLCETNEPGARVITNSLSRGVSRPLDLSARPADRPAYGRSGTPETDTLCGIGKVNYTMNKRCIMDVEGSVLPGSGQSQLRFRYVVSRRLRRVRLVVDDSHG